MLNFMGQMSFRIQRIIHELAKIKRKKIPVIWMHAWDLKKYYSQNRISIENPIVTISFCEIGSSPSKSTNLKFSYYRIFFSIGIRKRYNKIRPKFDMDKIELSLFSNIVSLKISTFHAL